MKEHCDVVFSYEKILPISQRFGEQRDFLVNEISDQDFGGAFPKNVVSGEYFVGNNKRELNLFVKKASVGNELFGDERLDMTMAERYQARWRYLRSFKIPTATSMRVVDESRVAMGMMTLDGGEFFGKAKWSSLHREVDYGVRRPWTLIERKYMEIDTLEIEEKVYEMYRLCLMHGIDLPGDDDFDILVRPDGTFQPMVLDLSYMSKLDLESSAAYFDAHEMAIWLANSKTVMVRRMLLEILPDEDRVKWLNESR